jgi:hypothetical protein
MTKHPSAEDTDKELWRLEDDYYAPRIFVTEGNGIGIDVGGHCIVMPVHKWHELAKADRATANRIWEEAGKAFTERALDCLAEDLMERGSAFNDAARMCRAHIDEGKP